MRLASAVVFAGAFGALDVGVRGVGAYAREPVLVLGLAASAALAASVLCVRAKTPRALLGALFGATFAAQALFVHFWHLPIDRQVAVSAIFHATDVRAVLLTMAARIALTLALGAAAGALLVTAAPVLGGKAPRVASALVLLAMLAIGPPLRSATPELALLDATAAIGWRRSGAPSDATSLAREPERDPESPPLAVAGPLPNVVFILTESVRATDACAAKERPCVTMPAVTSLVPDRLPLAEMRAVSSYTAVSLSALITGRTQTGERAAFAGAPTLFDLLKRVRSGESRPHLAYWSSQMASVFEREGIDRVVDSFVSVETLVGRTIADEDEVIELGVDRLLVAHAQRELSRLPRPFFLFLQLAGTHAPYFVDEARAPFSPWSRAVSWSKLPELHNAYKNAIFAQDAALAELMKTLFSTTAGSPLVVFYTSDHGEAFGEHGAIHHGQNLYDEQIHVPAWVVSRDGGLSALEIDNVRKHERALVTHLDLLPSVLDVYGAWNGFALRSTRRELRGRSLLAEPSTFSPIPITNCTAMFPCPLNAWGMLGEARVLQAQVWDPDWRCSPRGSADTLLDASDPACASLRRASRDHYPTLPNRTKND